MTVQRCVVGWPRWTEEAVFSGGSWETGYPVTNLGILPLSRVARSTDATLANTKFTVTLPQSRVVRCFAFVRHNLSVTAQFRIRTYSDEAGTTLSWDSGWTDVWQPIYPSFALDFEVDNWWSGTPTAEDLAGSAWTRPVWIGDIKVAWVIQVEIDDTVNGAGYVDIGMFDVAQGWQATVNPDYGATFGHRFRTQQVEALGGVNYFERRLKPRVWRGQISAMPRDEQLANGFEHLRQADIDKPFLWLPHPDEPVHWLRTVFLARNTSPGLLAYSASRTGSLPMAFEEVF